MTTLTPPRRVDVEVLRRHLFAAELDDRGQPIIDPQGKPILRRGTLALIDAETEAGTVTKHYLILEAEDYVRVEAYDGADRDVYDVEVRHGKAIGCTCPAAIYKPDSGLCKHARATNELLRKE